MRQTCVSLGNTTRLLCQKAPVVRLLRTLLILMTVCLATTPSLGAPLSETEASPEWVRDAYATLVARGLIEGYPDRTFKGDRSITRWELATLVARLQTTIELEGRIWAIQEDRHLLRRLGESLSSELEALGVHLDQLENNYENLEVRVSELERITFYGQLETRFTFQSFQNRGAGDNDDGRGGAGLPGPVPYLPYESIVGSRIGPPLRPQVHGIFPVVDYRHGRALTSGTGFTSLATLGLAIELSDDFQAGLELYGFSSQGDEAVDAYWGVTAPYTSNIFTADAGSLQPLNNTPYTRMALDRFWLLHRPSQTRVILGNIEKTDMDSFVYAGQPNLGVFGPRRFPGYGLQVTGSLPFLEEQSLTYEVLGTRFGDGVRFLGDSYTNDILAANIAYRFSGGRIKLNAARMVEEASTGGNLLAIGLTNNINVAAGASSGWSIRQWVNPPGFYLQQLPPEIIAQIGAPGNTSDIRPISGWSNLIDSALGVSPGGGNYGPQSQNSFGFSGQSDLKLSETDRLTFGLDLGLSDYRPNRNSPFTSRGQMVTGSISATLLDEQLQLGAEYLSIAPNYNPASWAGNSLGVRFPTTFNFTGVFHLHDFLKYPHNRQGWRWNGRFAFHNEAGAIWTRMAKLEQKRTSLYDVRVTPGALAPGAPNVPVLGFAPGFVDPVFYGYAHPSLYGNGSANSFTANLTPLEDPRGRIDEISVGGSYRLTDARVRFTGSYDRFKFRRDSSLSPALGGSQNLVKVTTEQLLLEVAWDVVDQVTLKGGVERVHSRGHYDPGGLYNGYALKTGSIDFQNLDSEQVIPHLGLDWRINQQTDFSVTLRYYNTTDRADPGIAPGLPELGQIGSTAHPFSWSGLQVGTHWTLRF